MRGQRFAVAADATVGDRRNRDRQVGLRAGAIVEQR
jgi:hypothetical protein